jgi:hypothetical protein
MFWVTPSVLPRCKKRTPKRIKLLIFIPRNEAGVRNITPFQGFKLNAFALLVFPK